MKNLLIPIFAILFSCQSKESIQDSEIYPYNDSEIILTSVFNKDGENIITICDTAYKITAYFTEEDTMFIIQKEKLNK